MAGEASFSTLLFQDISVIPILAILPIVANYKAKHHDNEIQILIQKLPEWLQAGTVIFGVALLILLGRYVFVPFLRYVSKSGMTELLTASSLFLVIGVSELMIVIGLSPALGAFLAGVMLANSEFRHELEAQIDPFKGLLLAVFFCKRRLNDKFQYHSAGSSFYFHYRFCCRNNKICGLVRHRKVFQDG